MFSQQRKQLSQACLPVGRVVEFCVRLANKISLTTQFCMRSIHLFYRRKNKKAAFILRLVGVLLAQELLDIVVA